MILRVFKSMTRSRLLYLAMCIGNNRLEESEGYLSGPWRPTFHCPDTLTELKAQFTRLVYLVDGLYMSRRGLLVSGIEETVYTKTVFHVHDSILTRLPQCPRRRHSPHDLRPRSFLRPHRPPCDPHRPRPQMENLTNNAHGRPHHIRTFIMLLRGYPSKEICPLQRQRRHRPYGWLQQRSRQ